VSGSFNDTRFSLSAFIRREVFQKKLLTPWGIAILIMMALMVGYISTTRFFFVPVAIAAALIGISIVYFCLFKPLIGYYILTFIAFFAFYPNHLLVNVELPLSTGVEVLTIFVFLGTFLSVKGTVKKRSALIRSMVSISLIIYTAYYLIELFNPNMQSTAGWFASFKRYVVYLMIYVIAYRLIDTPSKFRFFLKFWLVFSFVAALYGCYQQWFGLLPMELNYIMKDPLEFKLMNQGGNIRKFSFLSDVVSFGVLSGGMAVITMLLAVNEKNIKRKRILWLFAVIMTLGMFYSGTRTTTIMLPAGIGLYTFLTIQNKRTLMIVFMSFLVGFFVLFAPIDTPVLNRIRSTFNTEEASLNVRDVNRHYIQPYIYAHPIGGGVATSGVDGNRYNPGHELAGFPPDSGLLKSAIEMGWIGLALMIFFNLAILYQGIHYHFRMQSPEYKKYIAAILSGLFAIIVTQYSQVSVGQIPSAIFIFSVISLMTRLMEFDEQEVKENSIIY
jgi:hypothetical protein